MNANGEKGTEEHKRKTNGPFLKPGENQIMPVSPRWGPPSRQDWPESLPNDNVIGNQGNGIGRYITPFAGSEIPSTSFCSTSDSKHIVDKLAVKNNKNLNTTLVSHQQNFRQPQQNQSAIDLKYNSLSREIVPKVEEQTPLRLSKGLKGLYTELWGLKSLSTRNVNHDPQKVVANISNIDETFASSNAQLISNIRQSASSTYNYPQLFVEKAVKGKGVVCQNLDKSFSLGGALMSQEDQKNSLVTKFQSDTLLRSNDDNNIPSLQRTSASGAETFNNGVNMREWLKCEGHKMNKSERLQLFKQILELVDVAHSQRVVLQDLRLSCFTLLPSSKIKYIGSSHQQELVNKIMTCNVAGKRSLETDLCAWQSLSSKQQKLCEETRSFRQPHHFGFLHGCRTTNVNQTGSDSNRLADSRGKESLCQHGSSCQHASTEDDKFMSVIIRLEKKWYCSPEVLNDGVCTFSSNIYSLGVLLFELMCYTESLEAHPAVMLDLCHRILPPKFLSENPKEAGFCLWLLHPEPSSRPNTRAILESEFILESEESSSRDDVVVSEEDVAESEQLSYFLLSLKEEKKKQEAKLAEELKFLDEDIKEVERSYAYGVDSAFPLAQMNYPELRGTNSYYQSPSSSDISRSTPRSFVDEARFMSNTNQLQNSYFSMRFQVLKEASAVASNDKNATENRWRFPYIENAIKEPRTVKSSVSSLGSFFDGICKFARYSKFEERGTLRNSDLLGSANVICALSFDRDEDHIAAGGVSKKIKIFDLNAISDDSLDIQCPVVEMSNKSKLSCVCWNSYIKNHLASTDYDGVVQMWDASSGQPLSQYMEHQKRAWSVHFSVSDPKMFASGSDDCSVKLWNISEKNSLGTIWSPANVCCVQFSSYSAHLLFFGSADYKVYGYDLRHTRTPWCTFAGHGKTVSYVKFLDAQTVVSASTDNTLKLWDLKKTSSSGLSSDACDITFKGHSNEKNFVGLSVLDGYIACGSESNEVFCYHKSLPVPIASHKFESMDPISGHSNSGHNNGQFVSSVCWRKKSNMLVAANSVGIVKLLQMV